MATVAPRDTASETSSVTVFTCLALMSGPRVADSSSPLPRVNSLIRLTNFSVNSSRTAFATWNRLAAVHASPPLRILARIAPSTAASTSASSNTTNGALPPSSIDVRSSFSADCLTNALPTPVDPVKVSLRSRPSLISASVTAPGLLVGSTDSTPLGNPASSISLASSSIVSGVS